MNVYVDVNVLYYFLTANEEFGERARDLLERYSGNMMPSALTVWQLYILFRRQKTKLNITDILLDLGIEVVPLTMESLGMPKDAKSSISTMPFIMPP